MLLLSRPPCPSTSCADRPALTTKGRTMDLWNSHAFTARPSSAAPQRARSSRPPRPHSRPSCSAGVRSAALQSLASPPRALRRTSGSLVVVQLAGGNDGLNTVIPFMDSAYHKLRPGIGIGEERACCAGCPARPAAWGCTRSSRGMKERTTGLMTLVQGVGYPNPNRSHFKSMDIWHTADDRHRQRLARAVLRQRVLPGRPHKNGAREQRAGQARAPNPMAGIAIGREALWRCRARTSKPIGFEVAGPVPLARQRHRPAARRAALPPSTIADAAPDPHSNAAFLMHRCSMQISSDLIRRRWRRTPASYPARLSTFSLRWWAR